jgi:glycosyltransferase involved in cell wall biosynthesis
MLADFATLDSMANSSEDLDEKIKIYKEIVSRAQTDNNFYKSIDIEKFWQSSEMFQKLKYSETSDNNLSIAILGYGSDLFGYWDPFMCESGLPGSEECAVYASQELAKRGHKVTLYMNPSEKSIWRSPLSNPRWLPESMWHSTDNNDTYDLVLMWRRFDHNVGRKRGKMVFFWSHDSPPTLPPGQMFGPFPLFDGICILSKHHRLQFNTWNGFNNIPYTICGNGIVPSQFNNPMNITNPYSVGYFSNYARGLILLIIMWPEIRKEFPEATLSICYGRETWKTMLPDHLQFVIEKIKEYESIGVIEYGKVGHLELASIMQMTSVWAYPCTALSETYCITAIKCQASGCIPVTTRIAALNETVHPEAPNIPVIQNNNDIIQYKDLLLNTLRRIRDNNPEEIKAERQKYINFSKTHTWSNCVDKWLTLYQSLKISC